YEFEFIHPFIDGNGRMGRLWQSLILGKLHPLFEHLPVENMVFNNQQQYYDAINASTNVAQSGPFIDFMLGEIYRTLKSHQDEPLFNVDETFNEKYGKEFGVKFGVKFGVNEKKVLLLLDSNPSLSAGEIAEQTGLSKRGIEKQIKKFRDLGVITRKGSDKSGLWLINSKS
ncbi:MAG: Fic family protein, partial [Bacteroidaceae bacterium]|nr:Fic family protein [Bacteroidaceae bacterium]